MGIYEAYTYEFILARALARIPATLDKREGSIIYDALSPACYELAEVYMEMDNIFKQTFADTSTGDYLTRRASELGVERGQASAAVRKGVFNIAVPIGSRFSIENLNYVVTTLISGLDYQLTCEEVGSIGNAYIGALQPITYINGLTTATLTDILIPGEDVETDEALRSRYFITLAVAPFGGNVADYKQSTLGLPGVGGVKVYPVWDGGGSVKLVIIASDYTVPTGTLITAVQTAIDPTVNAGEGLGLAPIGHIVTVEGVTSVTINVSAYFTLAPGYNWNDVDDFIIANFENYLLQLRQDWDSETALVVRLSQVESAMLQVAGVLDITGMLLNGVAANIVLSETQIPYAGTVTNL